MNASFPQLNLFVAWLWILLGFASGIPLGLCFQRDDWLGGYASLKRRLYRLGHISFFGLGAANLLFYYTAQVLHATGGSWRLASWSFVVGAATMPLCCVLMARRRDAQALFGIPVVSLLTGAALTLWEITKL